MNTDVELELTWYFGGGMEKDIGVRSAHGGFEGVMRRLAMAKRGQPWELVVKESSSNYNASHDAISRLHSMLSAISESRRIYNKLKTLTAAQQQTLESQFGDQNRIKGISFSLLCNTKTVKSNVVKVNTEREAKARKKQSLPPCEITVTDVVKRLIGQHSQGLSKLLKEAGRQLDDAILAYMAGQ